MTDFIFKSATASEDAHYAMVGNSDITIQQSPYMRRYGQEFTVNVWVENGEAMDHYPCKTLAEAKAKAIKIANN